MTSLRICSNSILARSSFAFLYRLSAHIYTCQYRIITLEMYGIPYRLLPIVILLFLIQFTVVDLALFCFHFLFHHFVDYHSSVILGLHVQCFVKFCLHKLDSFNSIMFLMRLNNFSSFICWHRLVLEPWISSIDCYLAGHCTLTQCLPRHTQTLFFWWRCSELYWSCLMMF